MARSGGTRRRRREEARAAAFAEEQQRRAESAGRRKRLALIAGGVLAVAAVVAVVVLLAGSGGDKPSRQAAKPTATAAPVTASSEDFSDLVQRKEKLGDPLAPYTLVEYGDLVCPPCKTYAEKILPPVIEKYVRPGKLRIEFRPFGFVRPQSTQAAQYAWAAADQNKLWDFTANWFANQRNEDTSYVNDAYARRIAALVPGLDADKLIKDSHTQAMRRRLDPVATGFVQLGFQVTPAFAASRRGGVLQPIDLGTTAASAEQAVRTLVSGG